MSGVKLCYLRLSELLDDFSSNESKESIKPKQVRLRMTSIDGGHNLAKVGRL